MKKLFLYSVSISVVVLLSWGCSTQKNTRMSRAFHNLTSQYNVYFNANESLEKGVEKIDESIEDDFTRILPIYKASDPSAAKLVKSDMELTVIKASKLIEIHSITEKPKRKKRRTRKYQEFASQEEFNNWIDDSYLLMGKAYYYQHNFMAAITNLSYVTRKYPDDESKYEAYVWLIRSYSELGRFVEASEVIQAVQTDDNFPRKLERDLAVATADYYMKQQEYAEAIKFLDIALKKTFWKGDKARLQYIEAQLYQEIDKPMLAASAYEAVRKMNPDYIMAFNAKINAAGVFSGEGDAEKTKKELHKMLRDKKNVDFRDQIYYALGNIFFKEGNRDVAIENYASSVATSFQNQFQRALSAITLADIYFEDLHYRKAQAYYDSAMIIVDETYPNYQQLSAKYKSLSNLIDNLLTVEREDSLQKVAKMPPVERESLIARLMKEEQERQRNAENLALQGQQGQGYYRSNRYRMGMGSGSEGAGWYFYNPQTVSYGKVTFQQRWGRRKLEDDWRRSNKNTVSMDEIAETEAIDSSQMIVRVEDPLQKEFYTQDLPLNDSLMAVSHQRIRDALYNAGKIFKSEFSNYQRSAASFEELVSRYPETDYVLSAWFDLYDLYELMGDKQKADYYRNLIISTYPESKYAQFLVNPNFFVEMEARTDSMNQLYQETFRSYRSGRYRDVITLAQDLKKMKPDSIILPKLDFMEMVAQGTQTDIHNFEFILNGYITTYPKAEPTPLAAEILQLIQDSTLADYQKLVDLGYINEEIQNEELLMEDKMANDEFGGKYSYEEDLLHYFVIAYPRSASVDLNRLKFDIANYNIDHYTKIDFDIETENLNDNVALAIIRSLENKENALIYHRAIIRKAPVFQALKGLDYVNFVVSSNNYREVMNEKSLADYLKFFVKNYSRYIGPDFSDDELELSPEEMMAKAREEEEMLREKGEFVVVNAGAANNVFTADIDTTQSFVLAVKDLGMSLRQALNGFSTFNRNEFRVWNLALQLKKAGDYQLLVVKGIPTLNESMSYFRKVVITRDLFEPLGKTTYRNFLITDDNLQKLTEEENVEDYIDFFRANYIQRNQAQTPQTPQAEPPVSQPVQLSEEVTTVTEDVLEPAPEKYAGPYNEDVDKPHYFVFVIPKEGINKPGFVEGLQQFNQSNYSTLNLKIEEKPLDEFRQIVAISGLPDNKTATQYFKILVQDRDLYAPLGSGSYRNFLISNENFDIFLTEKNILDYMNFYKRVYLEN